MANVYLHTKYLYWLLTAICCKNINPGWRLLSSWIYIFAAYRRRITVR